MRGIDGGRIDAPFAHGQGNGGLLVVAGRSDDRQHFAHLHQARGRTMGIRLGRIGIQDGDAVHPVAVLIGVIVIFCEEQVAGAAGIGGHHAGRHDGRRIVPTKAARGLLHGEVAGEAQQEAPRSIARIAKDPEVHVAIRSHHRRRRAEIENARRIVVSRIAQEDPVFGRQRGGVETEQIAAVVAGGRFDHHIQRGAIGAQGRRGIVRIPADGDIIGGGAGEHIAGSARRIHAGKPALCGTQGCGRRALYPEPKIDGAIGAGRDRGIDKNRTFISGGSSLIGRSARVEDLAHRRPGRHGISVVDVPKHSAGTRVVESGTGWPRGQNGLIHRNPSGGREDVVGIEGIFNGAVAALQGQDLEAVARGLHGGDHGIGSGDQRRAVVGELARIVQVDVRRPADARQVLGRHGVQRRVLRVAAKRGHLGSDRAADPEADHQGQAGPPTAGAKCGGNYVLHAHTKIAPGP